MTEIDDEEGSYRFVMPFVATKSNGGNFDDEAYCAGWEMGKLDTLLATTTFAIVSATIRSDNLPQADLAAMRSGWALSHAPSSPEPSGWLDVTFTRG